MYISLFSFKGRRNDLFSKGISPVPQDDSHLINSTKTIRSLLSTPGISKNIKSDSVHCNPLSCVASGSRCHTADYLKDMKDVESSGPVVLPSLLKSPSVSTLLSKYDGPVPQDDRSLLSTPACSTNIKSDSVHCGPLSYVASGSRCHTADYLKEMKDMDGPLEVT